MSSLSTEMPISADLAATALWLRERADDGVVLEPVAATFIAEALDEIAMKVRDLEQALRAAHVEAVADALDAGREAAIGAGVVDGSVADLRLEFAREMRAAGRPVPPHLLARLADDGDAA